MTDEEILRALDRFDEGGSSIGRHEARQAAELIRRWQRDLCDAYRTIGDLRAHEETIRDRDARAALAMLHPIHHADASAIAREVYRIADAMAAERDKSRGE